MTIVRAKAHNLPALSGHTSHTQCRCVTAMGIVFGYLSTLDHPRLSDHSSVFLRNPGFFFMLLPKSPRSGGSSWTSELLKTWQSAFRVRETVFTCITSIIKCLFILLIISKTRVSPVVDSALWWGKQSSPCYLVLCLAHGGMCSDASTGIFSAKLRPRAYRRRPSGLCRRLCRGLSLLFCEQRHSCCMQGWGLLSPGLHTACFTRCTGNQQTCLSPVAWSAGGECDKKLRAHLSEGHTH